MNVVLLGKRQPNVRSLFAQNELGLAIDIGDRNGASEAKRTWRRNLLHYTEDLSNNTFWTKTGITLTSIGGGVFRLNSFASGGGDRLTSAVTAIPAQSYSWQIQVKGEGADIGKQIAVGAKRTTGTLAINSQVVTLTGDWQTVQGTVTLLTDNTGVVLFVGNNGASPIADAPLVRFPQLELAAAPTAYQSISDFSTEFKAAYPNHSLYVDSSGIAPAVYPGDQVGLVIDSSRGGLENVGPNLITNGTFDSNLNGWSTAFVGSPEFVWSAGKASVTNATTNVGLQTTISSMTQNKWYLVEFEASFTAGSIIDIRLGSGTSLGTVYTGGFVSGNKFRAIYRCPAAGTVFLIQVTTGSTATFDNISVKEIPGVHPYQTTSGSRPALARTPDGGRRNLLLYSEQFDVTSGGWTKLQSSITANNSTAPDGTTTADLFVEDSATAARYVNQSLATTAQSYTFSCYLKQPTTNARRYVLLYHNESVKGWVFDIQNGVVGAGGTSGVTAPAAYTITSVGNGWYRCLITVTGTAATNNFRVYLVTNDGSGTASYAGDGASGMLVWGAQLETGSSATTYQRVGLTSDVTESGKRDCWGLLFDSSDDSLQTASVDFSATDKMTVMAGVRKNVDTARATVCELTASIASNNGGFHLTAPNAASDTFAFESKGTSLTDAVATSIAAPATRVLTGIGNIAGDSTSLRVNGAVADTDTGDQGTGNYANAAVFIGSRGGSSLRFNGLIYTLIVRGATTPTGTIADFERNLLARRCGVTF